MNVDQLAEKLRRDSLFMENVVRWEELPAREARYGDYPIGAGRASAARAASARRNSSCTATKPTALPPPCAARMWWS